MAQHGDGPRRISTVTTTCRIIDALKHLGEAGVTELAENVEISKGTIHTHLATLHDEGYVQKDGDQYRLGFRFVPLGEHVRNETALYGTAREQVDELAAETGEYAQLVVENDGLEVSLYQSRGPNVVTTDYHARHRETSTYLHNSAGGKAILAYLDRERVEEIVDQHGLERSTDNTITDRRLLMERLKSVRERDYAYDNEEGMRGMRAVAAPIRNSDDVLGAVSVSAPTSRLQEDRFRSTVPERVTRAANVVEVNLEAADSDVPSPGMA